MTECEREPRVVHEWEAVNAGGLARSIRLYSNGSVYLLGKDGKHYDPAPSLIHQELARLAARCKRLEEALEGIEAATSRWQVRRCEEGGTYRVLYREALEHIRVLVAAALEDE